jgi:hypothetical protein
MMVNSATNINSNPETHTKTTTTYDGGLGQGQACGEFESVNGITTSPLDLGIAIDANSSLLYIGKQIISDNNPSYERLLTLSYSDMYYNYAPFKTHTWATTA